MKYTLFTALALGAAAIAYGDEGTDTYTTTTSETNTDKGNYSAWTVVWGSSTGLSTTLSGETATIPDTVSLSSITVTSPSYSASSYTSDVKLAVYTYTSTGSGGTTDVLGSLVGLSTNSTGSWSASTDYTFEFSDVTLESGTRYAFVFVSSDSTAESLASALESGTYSGTAFRVVVSSGLQSGGDFTRIYGADLATYWSGTAVDATYVTTAAVPEPATATLGLLALGALALRRRRA
ncbi:MAG: PEP-CTERM sorting domain-containing protein [Akkermansiaceae bacterium]|nr:PEP-CTERM sorting domain-containing protein [Akkermansiaceae bacterium]